MALFEYFPNYIWNLSLAIAVESGAQIGEIIDIVTPVRDAANAGADNGTQLFMQQWMAKADTLIELAGEDEARGRAFSAGAKLQRAALYLFNGERLQGHGAPGRMEAYRKAQDAFRKGVTLANENCARVEVPLGTGTMPALYTRAPGEGRKPVVVFCNGLDSNKELLFWTWLPHALAKRGISTLCVDQPGTGEAIRFQNLPATYASETWAAKAIDWLEAQSDVDPARIGMTGVSLGGHYVGRAVAFEPRFASGAVWGANHNWAEVQQKRLRREGENPVPHYWAHVMWVFGASDMDDFLAKAEGMTLNGVMERITVPFLVTHGAQDRQIGVEYAHQSYDQLTGSPRRELKIFTPREGGVEHVGADNMAFGRDYIADWFADTLGANRVTRRFVDLSITLDNETVADPPFLRPRISYQTHAETVSEAAFFFPGIVADDFPGGIGFAASERVEMTTHSGTHLDAPWHYHPTMDGGKRAITIDEVPLDWCFRPGVKLDFTRFDNGYVATAADVEAELVRIGHDLQPLDIVLVNTAAGKALGRPDYVETGCGMGYDATLYLTSRGVRVTGTDAWSWDAPFVYTARNVKETGDTSLIWEGHKAGREIGYCHMEKLHNLEVLPSFGFTVSCFPHKVKGGSAGWTRAVAIFED